MEDHLREVKSVSFHVSLVRTQSCTPYTCKGGWEIQSRLTMCSGGKANVWRTSGQFAPLGHAHPSDVVAPVCVTSSPCELFFLSSQRTWLFFQVSSKGCWMAPAWVTNSWLARDWRDSWDAILSPVQFPVTITTFKYLTGPSQHSLTHAVL